MQHTKIEDYADTIKPSAASNLLLWGILAFFVAFLIWAGLTSLDRTVRGEGRVIPSSQLQVVSNLEGGVVSEILVKTGAIVAKGDPLVRLSPLQTSADLGSSRATTGALAIKMARLEAEVAGRDPVYPAAVDIGTGDLIAIERALHASRMADLSALTNAASARINQAQRAVIEAQANYDARVTARNTAAQELAMIRPLVDRGIEPRMTLVQAENAASVSASEASAAAATIARAQAGVAEARSALAQLRQDWQSRAGAELAQAQAEFSARSRTMPALADRVERTTIRAPLGGRVNRVLVNTVGGSIAPGAPIAEIVPSEKSLLIEALVTPKDIAFVRIGQKTKIDITAYDSSIYGSLDGEVITISPDATINERTGETHYTVKIRTRSNALLDKAGRQLPIGPGMTAIANLIGDKRTVLEYILSPITKLSEQAFRE